MDDGGRISRLRWIGWALLCFCILSVGAGWLYRWGMMVHRLGPGNAQDAPSILVAVGAFVQENPALVGFLFGALGFVASVLLMVALADLCAGAQAWAELACLFLVGLGAFSSSTRLVYEAAIHPKYSEMSYPDFASMWILRYTPYLLLLLLAWAAYARLGSKVWAVVLACVVAEQVVGGFYLMPLVWKQDQELTRPVLLEAWRYFRTDEYANFSSFASSRLLRGSLLELASLLDDLLYLASVPIFFLTVHRRTPAFLRGSVPKVAPGRRASDRARSWTLTFALVAVFLVAVRAAVALMGNGWGSRPTTLLGTLWMGVSLPLMMMFGQVFQSERVPGVVAAVVLGALAVPALYWASKALVLGFWPGRARVWSWRWGLLALVLLHGAFLGFLWH